MLVYDISRSRGRHSRRRCVTNVLQSGQIRLGRYCTRSRPTACRNGRIGKAQPGTMSIGCPARSQRSGAGRRTLGTATVPSALVSRKTTWRSCHLMPSAMDSPRRGSRSMSTPLRTERSRRRERADPNCGIPSKEIGKFQKQPIIACTNSGIGRSIEKRGLRNPTLGPRAPAGALLPER